MSKKTFRWHGEEISYNEDNLVPLVARCVQISQSSTVEHIINLIEGSYNGEELLYGDWQRLKKNRLNVYL